MLSKKAKVKAIDDGIIWLDIGAETPCTSCQAKASCGHRLLSSLHPQRDNLLEISDNNFKGNIGSEVEIGIEDNAALSLSFVFYLAPLLIMIGTVLFVNFFNASELVAICSALLGLILGFCTLHQMTKGDRSLFMAVKAHFL